MSVSAPWHGSPPIQLGRVRGVDRRVRDRTKV